MDLSAANLLASKKSKSKEFDGVHISTILLLFLTCDLGQAHLPLQFY